MDMHFELQSESEGVGHSWQLEWAYGICTISTLLKYKELQIPGCVYSQIISSGPLFYSRRIHM